MFVKRYVLILTLFCPIFHPSSFSVVHYFILFSTVAINSSIHSYLVVAYAKKEKVAVSVGFYYMSNAVGRLFGTLGSGILYTYVGEDYGDYAGSDAVAGLAACFLAGTICSFLAASITFRIDDHSGGLKCGSCLTIVPPSVVNQDIEDGVKGDAAAVDGKDKDVSKTVEEKP